jgi:hypothetical protein
LEDLYQEYNPEGFIPISVVIQDSSGYPATAEDAALWADELELTFPVLADSTGSFNETWNPDLVLPMAYIIDKDGIVVWAEAGGAGGLEEIKNQILMLLDGEESSK